MKLILSPLMLSAGLLCSTMASAGNYSLCDTDGCRNGGSAWTISSYAKTKYPIVLAHGLGGFSEIAGVNYWYGIPKDLVANGGSVFVTQVASAQSSDVRGEQLLRQVQEIRAITGAAKVNLIGHSHGAQSIRYVAGVAPQQVASATSVGGPNTGSPVADAITGITVIPGVGPIAATVISSIVNALTAAESLLSGHAYDQNSLGALASLNSAGAAAFNARFPAGMPSASNPCGQGAAVANGVRYYSWGGTSILTSVLDPLDYTGVVTQPLFGGQANDGLVPRCSSHLGMVIRDNYGMNHFDEVNQTFGLVNLFETNPVAVFRQQANRLKLAGL